MTINEVFTNWKYVFESQTSYKAISDLKTVVGDFFIFVFGLLTDLKVLAMIGMRCKDDIENFGLGVNTVETKSISDYYSVIKGNRPLQLLAVAVGT